MMTLEDYRKKRDFSRSPEPRGEDKTVREVAGHFIIQKHQASHLHYDLRFEHDGTLKSWAVPKGIPQQFSQKRLAIQVEDHPLSYKDFEGVIPKGNYGAGTVMVWDEGEYKIVPPSEGNGSKHLSGRHLFRQGLEKGHLRLQIKGKKIKGNYSLVRTDEERNHWFIINKNPRGTRDVSIFKDNQSVKTGRTMEEIAQQQDSSVHSVAKLLNLFHLKETPMPDFIEPMLATLTDEPFDRENWIFEIKWDGYRCVSWKKGADLKLYSRNRTLFNTHYPDLLDPLQNFPFDLICDGEIVVLDEKGRPNFQHLQNYRKERKGYLVYYIFDLLYIQHYDLRSLKLSRRKEILRKCLTNQPDILRYSDEVPREGKAFFQAAKDHQLEGILAKNCASTYQSGRRSLDWLKIKTINRQEALICGFTKPRGGRKFFGALILGVHEGGRLRYIGHTGGGFDDEKLRSLHHQLSKLTVKDSPFDPEPATNMPVTWVKPRLVCEVKFSEWTNEGHMRQPVFLGLRGDKSPPEITKEIVVPHEAPAKVKLTHLDKIFWPREKITKGDVIEYYQRIASVILPYLKDRPQSMRRHPNGIHGKAFFHKNVDHAAPEWIETVAVESDSKGRIRYLLCQNRDALAYINNLGCIEINPWHSRTGSLAHPDYVVLDLDPVEISFAKVVDVALAIKHLLDVLKITALVKTSGGRGMHVYIPIKQRTYSFEQGKNFAHLLCTIIHARTGAITSLERSPAKRRHKVYLDYLQNNEAQTLVAPYALRPREGAPVSTPLEWSELTRTLNPLEFNINTIFDRLKNTGDLWQGCLKSQNDISRVLTKIEDMQSGTKI